MKVRADEDLIKELRSHAEPVFVHPEVLQVLEEAAQRLTELTEENRKLKDWEAFAATELQTAKIATEQRVQQLMASRKEIERLREALKVYADEKNWHCTEFGEYHEHGEKCCKDGWWTRSENGYDIAREALKETNDAN